MKQEDILNFKKDVKDKSTRELEQMLNELNDDLNKMILNSDLIIKIAIIDELVKNRKAN